jgi:hypothetical protein
MPPMRAVLTFLVAAVSACGSVSSDRPDAPPAPTDAAIDVPAVDGALPQPGDLVWVRSMSAAFGLGVADGAGGLVFTGSITAPTDFGGGAMTPAGDTDLAIGGFKPDDASYVYQTRINKAGGGAVFGFLEMTDSIGNPLVYGVSYGNVDLGKGPADGGNGGDTTFADGYIGRYGPNAPAWVNRIVGPGEDKIVATAPAPGGEVYGAGWFNQTPTWNGLPLTSAGDRDLFISRMNTFTGAVSKTATFGGTGRDEISSIAGDGTNLIVGGFFDDALAFGGAAAALAGTAGNLDVFVAKLDANLAGVWAVKLGGTGEDRSTCVALDAVGDVYVAGAFRDQVAFGAVNLTALGVHDIFVAKLRGTNGSVVWAVQLGTPLDDSPSRILVDKAGHPVVVGSLNGDALIASFDASNGAMRWQKQVATMGIDSVFNASIGATGDIYAVVNLGGAFDFGKPLIGPPSPASVVMRIAP